MKKIHLEQRKLEVVLWSISMLLTTILMLHSARWRISGGALIFLLWGITPYAALFRSVSLDFGRGFDRSLVWIGRILALVLLVPTAFVYVGAKLSPSSSTSALVFVALPVWLLGGGFAMRQILLNIFGPGRTPQALTPACNSCGYNLTGNESGVCPDCGTRIESP